MAQSLLKKCEICEDHRGIYFCYECQQVMCKPCRTSHGKIQATKNHSITESSIVDRTILGAGVYCKSHDKDFVLFCEKCTCLVCTVCIASTHKGHSFHEIEEAANNKRKVIQQKVTGLQAKINNLSSSIEDVKFKKQPKIKEGCEQYVGNIRDLASEFHNMIDFVSETNITQATDFSTLEQQQLEYDLSKLETTYKEYIQISKNLAQSLNQKHDITFLVGEQSLRTQFECLPEIPLVKEPEQFKDFNKVEFTSQIIDQIRLKYSIRIIEETENTVQRLQADLQKEQTKHAEREVEIIALKHTIDELNRSSKINIEEKEKAIQMLKEKLQIEKTKHVKTAAKKEDEVTVYMQKINMLHRSHSDLTIEKHEQEIQIEKTETEVEGDFEVNYLDQKTVESNQSPYSQFTYPYAPYASAYPYAPYASAYPYAPYASAYQSGRLHMSEYPRTIEEQEKEIKIESTETEVQAKCELMDADDVEQETEQSNRSPYSKVIQSSEREPPNSGKGNRTKTRQTRADRIQSSEREPPNSGKGNRTNTRQTRADRPQLSEFPRYRKNYWDNFKAENSSDA